MTSITRFAQILKPCTTIFQKAVAKNHANKYLKGFSCENLLQTILLAQWSQSQSLRILQQRVNPHIKLLKSMNMPLISHSTLSYALAHRSTKPFEETVCCLMALCKETLPRQQYKELKILDSTPFRLTGKGFDSWVKNNGRIKGMKMHTLISSQNNCIEAYQLTLANQTDVSIGKQLLQIEKGQTYVFDKGYCDYNWWWQIHQSEAFFVTRAKSNAALKLKEKRAINQNDSHTILADEVLEFVNHHQKKSRKNHYTEALRRITVWRADAEPLILLSNDFTSQAIDIASQYRNRWQIELWFKWIKQHLNVKHFLGKSENAVQIQILCALIAYLLLRLYHVKCGAVETVLLHGFFAWLSVSLFERATQIHWQRRLSRYP